MTRKIVISKKTLEDLYLNKKLSTYKIAKRLNCDPSVIQKRLKEYDIRTRSPKKKIIIQKEKLQDLYLGQRLSVSETAKKIGISHCSLYYKLKEAGIEPRKKRLFNPSKNKLEKLYLKNKLSCSKIAQIYGINTVTVFEKLKKYSIKTRSYLESNIKYPKKVFDGSNELKAYMVGFRLGDLNVKSLSEKSTVIIKSSTTKEDQVNLIKEIYGGYGHFWVKRYGDLFSTMTFLDNSFNFLVKKEDDVDDWIMQRDKFFFAFLAGYSDAEGNFGIYGNAARFRIGSYDKNILKKIYLKLNSLEIKANFNLEGRAVKGKHNQDFYRVSINGKKSLIRFINLLKPYIKHAKRYKDMVLCEKNILERNKKQNVNLMI